MYGRSWLLGHGQMYEHRAVSEVHAGTGGIMSPEFRSHPISRSAHVRCHTVTHCGFKTLYVWRKSNRRRLPVPNCFSATRKNECTGRYSPSTAQCQIPRRKSSAFATGSPRRVGIPTPVPTPVPVRVAVGSHATYGTLARRVGAVDEVGQLHLRQSEQRTTEPAPAGA